MTERTAAETERPGEGKTLGEMARDGFYGSHIGPKVEPWHKLDEETQSWWEAAAEAATATIIPCTFPSCLSAQTAAKAGEEIARLKEARDACAEARDRNGKHWAETDRMLKKSMVESDQLRSDIAALKAELSNLIAATKGQTFFHSDEAVNAEMGRLRGEVEELRETLGEFVKADSAYFNAPADSFSAAAADDRLIRVRRRAKEALKTKEVCHV